MSTFWFEMQFYETNKNKPFIKVIHYDTCPELQKIPRDRLSGPYTSLEDVMKNAEKTYSEIPIRRCDVCF